MKPLAILITVAATAACASVQSKPSAACQNAPQWFMNDANGRPQSAIFVCFGDDHKLLWSSRPLTFDEIMKMVAPVVPPATATAKEK